VAPGGTVSLAVTVRNPLAEAATAVVSLVVPAGWPQQPPLELELTGRAEAVVRFEVVAGSEPAPRARVAADLTVAGRPFGQQAEALVDVG
jgi:hypothetical protein